MSDSGTPLSSHRQVDRERHADTPVNSDLRRALPIVLALLVGESVPSPGTMERRPIVPLLSRLDLDDGDIVVSRSTC